MTTNEGDLFMLVFSVHNKSLISDCLCCSVYFHFSCVLSFLLCHFIFTHLGITMLLTDNEVNLKCNPLLCRNCGTAYIVGLYKQQYDGGKLDAYGDFTLDALVTVQNSGDIFYAYTWKSSYIFHLKDIFANAAFPQYKRWLSSWILCLRWD